MAYILKTDNGKEFSTTSFYEVQCKKQELRRQGIKFKEKLTGAEKFTEDKRKDFTQWKEIYNDKRESKAKSSIRAFLARCDRVEQRYKKFNRSEDGRASTKSKRVGKGKTNK